MYRKNKNLVRMISGILRTLLCLCSTFTVTYAWFALKRTVSAKTGGFQAYADTGRVDSIEIYEQAGDIPYQFNSAPSYKHSFKESRTAATDSLTLKEYDGRRENSDSTRLFLFTLDVNKTKDLSNTLTIQARSRTDNDGTKSKNVKGSLVKTERNEPVHPISTGGDNAQSSVIAFQSLPLDEKPSGTNRIDRRNSVYGLASSSFVNKDDSNDTYSYTETDIVLFQHGKEDTSPYPGYIAAVVHYSLPAIEYIFNINLGNEALNVDTIAFACDWYFERLS